MCYDDCPFFLPYSETCTKRGGGPCPDDEDYEAWSDADQFAFEREQERKYEALLEMAPEDY